MSSSEFIRSNSKKILVIFLFGSFSLIVITSSEGTQCPYEDLCHGVECDRIKGYICRRNITACTYRCFLHPYYCPRRTFCLEPKCNNELSNTCKENGHECVDECNNCKVTCEVSRLHHTYPKNPKIIEQTYRKITIQWDELENFNKSGNIKKREYKFYYQIKKPTASYFHPKKGYFTRTEPKLTIENLPLNAEISIRVGLQERTLSPNFEYSLDTTVTTKPSEDIRKDRSYKKVLPGKVSDIVVHSNITSRKYSIEWRTPQNIIEADEELDKSIQYTVELCYYNPLLETISKCRAIAEVVSNSSSILQSTLQSQNSIFPVRFNMPTTREIAIKVTPLALNLERGPTETTTFPRLDPLSVPETPTGLKSIEKGYANITLCWDAYKPIDRSVEYLISYKPEGMKNESNIIIVAYNNFTTLQNLTEETTYFIKVAISESLHGSSSYSNEIAVTISQKLEEVSSTAETKNTSKMTKSAPLYIFLLNLTLSLWLFW